MTSVQTPALGRRFCFTGKAFGEILQVRSFIHRLYTLKRAAELGMQDKPAGSNATRADSSPNRRHCANAGDIEHTGRKGTT